MRCTIIIVFDFVCIVHFNLGVGVLPISIFGDDGVTKILSRGPLYDPPIDLHTLLGSPTLSAYSDTGATIDSNVSPRDLDNLSDTSSLYDLQEIASNISIQSNRVAKGPMVWTFDDEANPTKIGWDVDRSDAATKKGKFSFKKFFKRLFCCVAQDDD